MEDQHQTSQQQMPEERTSEQVPQQSEPVASTGGNTKRGGTKNIITTIIVLVVIALAALLIANYTGSFTLQDRGGQENAERVVAVVNEETITRGELDAHIQEFITSQGIALPQDEEERAELELQALNQMIDEALFFQLADSRGIEVTQEEIQQEYEATLSQFPDEEVFLLQLESLNLTEEEFRQEIANQLQVQKYFAQLAEEHDIVIAEEDIRAFFDEVSSQEGFDVAYEDIRDQIESYLQEQELSGLLPQIVEDFRESSTIEIHI